MRYTLLNIRVRARIQMLLTTLMAFSLLGCQDNDGDSQPAGPESVAVRLALAVAKSASTGTTRMASTVESNPNNINLLCVIPFGVNRTIEVGDEPMSETIVGPFETPQSGKAFFTSSCNFTPGVYSVLAYGDAKDRVAGPAKGALKATYPTDFTPENIRFELQPITTEEDYLENATATALAQYLTDIATASVEVGGVAKTWKKDASNVSLKLMYKNFINELVDGGQGDVLPGSTASVHKWVDQLETNLAGLTSLSATDEALKEEIRRLIATADDKPETTDVNESKWEGDWKNFPATVGLPDGAAVVRWDGAKFAVETKTTTIAEINNIGRFTYPAEIYYYGNSLVKVSDADLSGRFSSKGKWAREEGDADDVAVLDGFTDGPVTGTTSTVAMEDPLQYGVARLQVLLKQTASTIKGSDNADITVGTDKFKLTGIIVGGQLPVGFNFRPETLMEYYSESNMSFIYDSQVATNGDTYGTYFYLSSAAAATRYAQTLVLQSFNEQEVKLVLEFENDADVDFKGLNGTVYKGTKFYLVGSIKPTKVTENIKTYDNRVFTQDHTTTVEITVSSLAKAYNVLPNLLSPRLEMGLVLTPKWEQATPSDVIL